MDLSTVFKPLSTAARQARDKINAEMGGAAKDVERTFKNTPARLRPKIELDPVKAQLKEWERETKSAAKQRATDVIAANREIERDLARHAKEREKIEVSIGRFQMQQAKAIGREIGQIAGGTTSNFTKLAKTGLGIAGDVARGAGINFDISGGVKKRIGLESLAGQISRSGYFAPTAEQQKNPALLGAQNVKVRGETLRTEAQAIGEATAVAPEQVLEGLSKFVGKTGDLATGRDIMADMAKLAKATDSNLSDVVDAAGDVSNNLGNIPNKAQAIDSVMRAVAGQGKVGAVEMRNFASQMAKVAAAASQFGGNATENIIKLSALTQAARAGGGAATATSAATAAVGLVNTLKTPTSRKAFEKYGVNLRDKSGELRDPTAIITEAIEKTGGDAVKMKEMFRNITGERTTVKLSQIYRQAGGGATGSAAVKAEIDSMTKGVTISKEQIGKDLQEAMASTASKAELFQQKLDQLVGDMGDKVIPEMVKLAPKLLQLTEAFTGIVSWATKNPFEAITAALGASALKSFGESFTQRLFSQMLSAPSGGAGGGVLGSLQAGSTAGTAMRTAGAALAIAAAAVTIEKVGELAIDKVFATKAAGEAAERRADIEGQNAASSLSGAQRNLQASEQAGVVTPEAYAAFEKAKQDALEKREAVVGEIAQGTKESKKGTFGGIAATAGASVNSALEYLGSSSRVGDGKDLQQLEEARAASKHLEDLKQTMQRLDQKLGGVLRVESVGGAPGIDQSARTVSY